jgi:hypothetical protein
MTCMLPASVHVRHSYAFRGQSPYVTTFHYSSTVLNESTAPEKKGSYPDPQHAGWPICRSILILSPITAIEAVVKNQSSVGNMLHQFTMSISSVCDQYVQYLLVGVTHRSLTDTDGGYNFKVTNFTNHSPRPSQPTILVFLLRALFDHQWNILKHKPNLKSRCVDIQQSSGLRTTQLLTKPITMHSNANDI